MKNLILSVLLICPLNRELRAQTLTHEENAEIVQLSQNLGEVMRHDVEAIYVDPNNLTELSLPNTESGKGALSLIVVEGRGGGNLFQLYVALFELKKPDFGRLKDLGGTNDTHPYVALLAYDQIDTLRWRTIDWKARVVDGSHVVVPACERAPDRDQDCPIELRGQVVIDVDGAILGPNFRIENYPR